MKGRRGGCVKGRRGGREVCEGEEGEKCVKGRSMQRGGVCEGEEGREREKYVNGRMEEWKKVSTQCRESFHRIKAVLVHTIMDYYCTLTAGHGEGSRKSTVSLLPGLVRTREDTTGTLQGKRRLRFREIHVSYQQKFPACQ